MQKCVALIVAAGKGNRFGSNTPKQYHSLCGEPVLRRTIKAFLNCPEVLAVKVVIHRDNVSLYEEAVRGLSLLPPCFGGKERQDSVRLGLESLQDEKPDIVLIHDAARPFVTSKIISDVIANIHKGQGAISAAKVTDTIKKADENNNIETTIDRSCLWKAATPQGFMYDDILAAHKVAAGQALTDDAAVAENYGLKCVVVSGSAKNIKITTSEDMEMAEKMLQENRKYKVKTGFGFDVHAFTNEKDFCILGGVKIPFDKGLKGHSDADVLLHALTDALLGAIGMGDIGTHFSDKDERWRGADSSQFLKYAADCVKDKGGVIENVDVTVICEAPRIGKYREEITQNIANILEIPSEDVNIKGTTTEHLGFTGRQEGIAATAIATIGFI